MSSLSKSIVCFVVISIFSYLPAMAAAQKDNISKNLPFIDIEYKNKMVRIERNQNSQNALKGIFTKTSRNCPPFCIQPMEVAPGIKTIGELEVVDFLANEVKQESGVLIDARTPEWHIKGTIPGSVNIPFTVFGLEHTDAKLITAMQELGVKHKSSSSMADSFWSWTSGDDNEKSKNWDFSGAKNLILWCNGMWCGQSPRAIKNLLKHGYPADKIKYFRGGMQTWLILGLTVVKP